MNENKPTQVIVVENNPVHFQDKVNELLKQGYIAIPETLLVDPMRKEILDDHSERTLFQYLVVVTLPYQTK